MAKGRIVASRVVKRSAGKMYFVDGSGNVREASMNRKGGTAGRRTCSAPKRKSAPRKKARAKTARRKR